MLRSTKIVATLGPASSDPAVLERMVRAGVDVVRLNFSHGTAEDHLKRAALVKEICHQGRPHGRHHVRPAGPEDPRRQVQGRQGRRSRRAQTLHPRRRLRDRRRRARPASTTRSCRATSRAGAVLLLDDGKIVLDVTSVRGERGAHHGAPRRRAVEQQGHQPPGRRADRARAHGQGHGGHPHRGEDQGRLPRGVVPEERRRHVHGARAAARRRRQGVPDRQDRARRGGARGRAARHHARLATASWWRAATSRSRSATPRCRRCRRR